jgi:hypothetical protein
MFSDICFYKGGKFGSLMHSRISIIRAETTYVPVKLMLGHIIQDVVKVALPKYLIAIIRRCQMLIEHAGQKF